jgi:hypothetical protein
MTPTENATAAEPIETVASTGLRRPVPLVVDLDEDPLEGIPAEVMDLVGSYDSDTPGGCG